MIRTLFNKKTIDDDIIYTLNEDVYYRVKTDKETKTINEKLEEIESELNEIDIVPTRLDKRRGRRVAASKKFDDFYLI